MSEILISAFSINFTNNPHPPSNVHTCVSLTIRHFDVFFSKSTMILHIDSTLSSILILSLQKLVSNGNKI